MLYSETISTNGIVRFAKLTMREVPRASALIVIVLIDIIRNQGDSPANVIERTTGDRGNTGAEGEIYRLVKLGICYMEDVTGVPGVGKAKRHIYLTPRGAEVLGLQLRPRLAPHTRELETQRGEAP